MWPEESTWSAEPNRFFDRTQFSAGGRIFEIKDRCGMGRTGVLTLKHGKVETPTLMPVINPVEVLIPADEMRREFGASLVMTNAYITMRRFGEDAAKRGVHGILNYDGPVMCDSGGYQILRYGDVDVTPDEIVGYQDRIAPDIATILDIPTGVDVSPERARWTVEETLKRARRAAEIRSNPNVLWCGPVQGGQFRSLVEECAREIGRLDYHIHAIGSPVELMEGYRYAELVELVMAAKLNLPQDRPVHLFGAGHPMMLSLAVLMGCDLFDSAAYALYAKDGRYITAEGTHLLKDLREFPCSCKVCSSTSPEELRAAQVDERVLMLARHNLHATFAELRAIRQAIRDGRLWEHVQMRCAAHPKMLEGLARLTGYSKAIERFDPVTKRSAFFYLGRESLSRPEVMRHRARLLERYEPEPRNNLLVLPCTEFERARVPDPEQTHVIRLLPVFGPVPEELEEIYPLSQFLMPLSDDDAAFSTAASLLREYLKKFGDRYERVLLVRNEKWEKFQVRDRSQSLSVTAWACEPVSGKVVFVEAEDFVRKEINK
ncbi:MAG: tRNA guanosine(15) transglycosylase TgtA [Candidatus Hadarchaeales archaeon]